MDYKQVSVILNNSTDRPPRPFATQDDFERFLQFVFIRYPEKLFWLSLKGIESGQLPEEMDKFVEEFGAQKN
jgi:hypothetical protein